jgi:hypothetical protein
MKQYDKAIAVLQKALEVDPLHASSEFVLARTLQRSGHMAEARIHFQRFQHLTSTKISAAIGLSYGEQGHYSTVTPIEEIAAGKRAMIPVRLSAQPLLAANTEKGAAFTTTGGACMMDVFGDGRMDLVRGMRRPRASRLRVMPWPAPWATTTATDSTIWPSPWTMRCCSSATWATGSSRM